MQNGNNFITPKIMRFRRTLPLIILLLSSFASFNCKKTHSKTPQQQHISNIDSIAKENVNEISILFIGDIMQHGPQIRAAYDDSLKIYDYWPCFAPIAPIAQANDFTIANLELTLAGEPFSGYPQFSAPDALAVAIQKAGIGLLVTANNHSCDRHKKGIERTIQVLDSLGIPHTGTFSDSANRAQNNILWLEKNGIKVALLNYTYGTNGIPAPSPTIVNLIDSVTIKADIEAAQQLQPDKIIVFTHWGDEYQRLPNAYQKLYANLCIKYGADYVIGSHPHVLQPMTRFTDSVTNKEHVVVYSLGNFVSNQRERYKDGGAMFKMVLHKDAKGTHIKQAGYFLTWVDKSADSGKNTYAIYPVSQFENDSNTISKNGLKALQLFKKDSEELFEQHNKNIGNYIYQNNTWLYIEPKK